MSSADTPGGSVVHEIRWGDALPWSILLRAAAAAFSPTVILLAALGAAAAWAGRSTADRLGLVTPASGDPAASAVDRDSALALPAPDGRPAVDDPLTPSDEAMPWLAAFRRWLPAPLADAWRLVTLPFRPTADPVQAAAAAAQVGWFLLVWAIFGTAISRCVALKLAGEESLGPVGALTYGSRKWPPAFNSVLFVLLGIAALSVPGVLVGAAMRTGWGLSVAGVLWPLLLLGSVVLAILAVGVAAGWPLMVAAVGVERGDSFQAISTAFSYLYQRPLHYAFYLLVGLLLAVPALAVAALFADAAGTLTLWATSFGMGHERTAALVDGLASSGPLANEWGLEAMRFWHRGLVNLLASFGWGYFWSIATAAYLVLRQDVDGTPLDEVVLDEPGTQA